MKDIKKIQIHNVDEIDVDVELKKREEEKEKEKIEHEAELVQKKEEEIQPVIKEEIEEVIAPPKPMEWWIKRIAFWALVVIVILQNALPVLKAVKYTMTSNSEIHFTKENTELVKAMRTYKEDRIKEIDEKIINAFQ